MADRRPMKKGGVGPLTYEAGLPLPLGGAGAPEVADQVLAGSSVLTGTGQTRPLHWGDKTPGFFLFFLEMHLCTMYNAPYRPSLHPVSVSHISIALPQPDWRERPRH